MNPSRFIYPLPGFDHYWKNGHGKKMLKKLEHIPDRLSIELKVLLLDECDSFADEVVRLQTIQPAHLFSLNLIF